MDYLNSKSLKLRDSYAESVLVADSVIKDGNMLPMEHITAIRQIVKLVDQELSRTRPVGGAVTGKQVKKDNGAPVATSIK